MRQLMDRYIDASSSQKLSDFENESLTDLIVNLAEDPREPYGSKERREAVAETIENNVRKVINEEAQTNPKYYEKLSRLLDEIIALRKNETLEYQEYLAKIKELAQKVSKPSESTNYPSSLDTRAKRALYDNLESDEELANRLHTVIENSKLDGWRDGGIKEKKLMLAVNTVIDDPDKTLELMDIIKAQNEY